MLTLFALALAAAQPAPKPLAETCPNLTAAERKEIERATGFGEITYYSRTYCVSLAEAKRRMDIQNRDAIGPDLEPGGPPKPPADSIGSVSARIEQGEPSTFAGLWIEHRPTYRVVVAFTRDAAATLRKYTKNPLFVPLDRPGPSQAELRATQERLFKELERFGARPTFASADIKKAIVEFGIVGDLTAFRAAVARGEVELPSYVVLQEPDALKFGAPPLPADWSVKVKAFPRAKFRSPEIELSILRTGTVVLEGGCLRLEGERKSPVIVWPNEAALDLREAGKVRVLNRMSGETIDLGKRINLGGNAGELKDEADVIDADPACPGPYYAIGNFGTMNAYDRSDFEQRVRYWQEQRKLSRSAAEQAVREEQQRATRLREIGRQLAVQATDRFGGLWANPDGGGTLMWVGEKEDGLALIPADLRRYVSIQQVPRSITELKGARDRLLDQIEGLGLKASVQEEVIGGKIIVGSDDLPALSRAALAGKLDFPLFATISTSGAGPEGYNETAYQTANRKLEAVPDFAEIRALIEETWLPGRQYGAKTGPRRRMSRAESLESARFLVALGFTAADIRRLRAADADPALAWGRINDRVGPEVLATVTRDVAVGELVELIPERLGDGYRSTAVLRLVEPLKGDRRTNETVRVRLVSGFDARGKLQQANDEPLVVPGLPGSAEKGSRWLMFLSPAWTGHHARMNGGSARPGDMAAFRGLFGLRGERLDRRFEPDWWPADLAGMRAALAPVDRSFDAADAQAGGRLQRRVLP